MDLKSIIFPVLIGLSIVLISCNKADNSNNKNLKKVSENQPRIIFTENQNKWTLLRDGKPYYIKGGHGITKMEWVKELGGNSIIAYHYELSDSLMNRASELGLTVSVILDIGKPRLGADYSSKEFLEGQRNWIKLLVEKYKNHDALLFWIIGNEAHLMRSNNYRLWREVNRISKMIHEMDKNHLTTTTIASYPTGTYQPLQLKLFAPDIDFLSLTIYEFAHRIKRETRNFVWGWNGPYMVSEWAGDPHWILPTTEWGAIIESSSTHNAKNFLHQYYVIFKRDTDRCIGGYVFYWGQKQERTHTAFSLILENKYKTAFLESVGICWTGQKPANLCPVIDTFYLDIQRNPKQAYLDINTEYSVTINASDPENQDLKMKWEIFEEGDYTGKWGGEVEKHPKKISGLDTIVPYSPALKFKTPSREGAFRLFVYVCDSHNNIATVNQPFYSLP